MRSLVSMSSNVITESIISNVVQIKEIFCILSVTGNVEKAIMSLNLPQTLGENIKKLAQPLIRKVQTYNYYVSMCGVKFYPNFASRLFFTTKGKLDYKLTTREVLLDEHLDIKSRVILACKFCFEDEILALWKSQPDLLRQLMKEEEASSLIGYWLKYLEEMAEPSEEFVWKDSVLLEAAFLAAVDDINLEGAQYFFEKMAAVPSDKKISILRRAARITFYPDHLPTEIKCIFIKRMKVFLVESQLPEYTLSLENHALENEVFVHRYRRLMEQYAMLKKRKDMLKNKVLSIEKEMLKNEEIRKTAAEKLNEIEMLDNEEKMLNEEIEILKNECEISKNNCEVMKDMCYLLLNEVKMLVYNL